MDSFDIIITPDAEADLLEIRDYIAYTLLVPDVALDYIRAIRKETSLRHLKKCISIIEVKAVPFERMELSLSVASLLVNFFMTAPA